MKPRLQCRCGQRVFSRDIMQHGLYSRQFGPNYIYVRYRCSRCKRLGEQYIRPDEWDEALLRDEATEVSETEREQFDKLGAISVDEMVRFHYDLEELKSLPRKD